MTWQAEVIASFATDDGAGSGAYAVTRCAEGTRTDGLWQPGATSSVSIVASVQPLDGDALKFLPEGVRAEDARLLFTTTPIIVEDGRADVVTISGATYRFYLVEPWSLDGVAYRCHCARTTG